MPKKVFWPSTLVLMGLIFMASNLGYLSAQFWNLWPIILIVVGLGGLLTSDRDEWLMEKARSKKSAKRRSTKKSAKRRSSGKKTKKTSKRKK
ncbi:MAG: DUF5668 domain-containing protein [Candidatus Paceibacterota bacterium]